LTIYARAELSVASKETTNRLKNLIGSIGYKFLTAKLLDVRLKIDAEKKLVTITKGGKTHEIGFDEIERMVNERSA